METSINQIHEQMAKCELDINNLTTFINQSLEKLKCKLCEYHHLQKELYIQDGLEKANMYANLEG